MKNGKALEMLHMDFQSQETVSCSHEFSFRVLGTSLLIIFFFPSKTGSSFLNIFSAKVVQVTGKILYAHQVLVTS